jgi:small subunit ribosomal protein S17
MSKKEILGVKAPEKDCTDKKCPFHGEINVKKELFKGKVVKKDINHSATIEWSRTVYIAKYERYEVKKSRLRVHNPACIDANIDDMVLVARTRPLSKVKNHVIIKIIDAEESKEIKK